MRNLKCKNLFVSVAVILTSLFVTFVINSTPVSAISPSLSIVSTGRDFETGAYECQYNEPANIPAGLWYCPATAPKSNGIGWSYLVRIGASNTIDTVAGNYYKALVIIHSQEEASPILWTINTTNDWIFTDLRVISEDVAREEYFLNYSSGNGSVTGNSSSFAYSNFYEVVLEAKNDGNYKWSFGFGNDVLWQPTSADLQLDNIVYLSKISEYSPDGSTEMNKKDEQDRSDISSQQSSVSADSSSSQQAASSTGTTLLAAFSSFVTAITSASPTNCKIDMDMGNLDLGLVDFCQLSPPPAFQTLSSIFLILFCVPLSIATARKVINLFRSFQG